MVTNEKYLSVHRKAALDNGIEILLLELTVRLHVFALK